MPQSLNVRLDLRGSADFRLLVPDKRIEVVAGTDAVYRVSVDRLTGHTDDVDLTVTGVPSGGEATFADNVLSVGEETTLSVDTTSITPGVHTLTTIGAAGANIYEWLYGANADRLIDWAYAGVPGGIPERTVVQYLGEEGYGPDDEQSVTAVQINSALVGASGSGQAVCLRQGTYNLTASVSLNTLKSVTLRGVGAGKTIINSSVTNAVTIGGSTITSATRYAVGDIAKGAVSVTLATTPPAACNIGGLVLIDEVADYDLMWHRTGRDSRIHSFLGRVTGVAGNTVSFTPPLPQAFKSALSPQVRFRTSTTVTSLCGVEDMTIKPTVGTISRGGFLVETDRCWLRGVEVTGYSGSLGMIYYYRCLQTEIRRCYIHDCYQYNSQADGYGIAPYDESCFSLLEDNIFNRTAVPIMPAGSSGNVFGYNYMRDVGRGSLTWVLYGINANHGPHCAMSLSEGNIMPQWENDGYHGSSSHQMLFRNSFNGLSYLGYVNLRWVVNLARASYYHTAVGNVIGDPTWDPDMYELSGSGVGNTTSCVYKLQYPFDGSTTYDHTLLLWTNWTETFPDPAGYRVRDQFLRHGNYDYYNKATVWNGAIESRAVPHSLYLAAKPAWFGSLAWPAIGPDVSGLVGLIPAKARWDRYVASANLDDLFMNEE